MSMVGLRALIENGFRKELCQSSMEESPEEWMKRKVAKLVETRMDIETPHDCHAGYTVSNFGTDLDAIEPFTAELTEIVDKMKEDLANEVRILEGTEVPMYVSPQQNELSFSECKEDQWKSVLPIGFSTIVPTHTLESDSNISFFSARRFSQSSDTPTFGSMCIKLPNDCCMESSDDCGNETDAMNECCECTVPMTSEPTPGTPNEVK